MFLAYTAENTRAVLGAQIQLDMVRATRAVEMRQAAKPKGPQPDSDVQPVNGTDKNPPPSFTGMTDETQPEAPGA
jgi:hypothetical protein